MMRAIPLFVALVSGCATTTSGTPSPGEVSSPTAAAPTSAKGGGASTALDPCELLKMDDLTSHGTFKAPTRENLGGARICAYSQTRVHASDPSFAISVGIRDSQSAESVTDKGRGKISGNVNGRKAFKVPVSSQDCLFALAIGENARVDLLVIGQDAEKACGTAEKFADVVEPRLPKQ